MRKLVLLFAVLTLLALALAGCGSRPTAEQPEQEPPLAGPETAGPPLTDFELTSSAFAPQQSIPARYTCDGQDISPPLAWTEPPVGTRSFTLIMDDPDAPAGTWVHWVLIDLPAEARRLPEAVAATVELAEGGRHGSNSWRKLSYGGPCPPSGTHRYFFRLYALDTMLGLEPGATKEHVLQAMKGHILAQAELMGTYTRK